MEIWKDVKEFEGVYLVSNKGNIKRHPNTIAFNKTWLKNTILKPQVNHCGYLYIDLCKDSIKKRKTIHQIVMASFYPNFHYGNLVNHIDGNKLNNCLENLEPTTVSDNEVHKYANNLAKKHGKSIYRNVSIQVSKYKDKKYITYMASVKINNKRIYLGSYHSEIEAAKAVDAYWDSIKDIKHVRNFPNS